ncbi:HNH endonuclease [Paenibacillus sp. V4I5]|uniref:HNH endonuclease n=1 Tax=Paenibacillus sp. V4I5 TaxID=3042306 RepID=UPI0027D83127|nr:HNH endonuclease signature motif containing protein [Paenibacillus sp. V4I5]
MLHQPFTYTDSTFLVSQAIQFFYEDDNANFELFWDIERDEMIIPKLTKSSKETVLHLYLNYVSGNFSIMDEFKHSDYSRDVLVFYENTLRDLGVKIPSKKVPNFEYIEKHGFCEMCRSCKKLTEYVNWLSDILEEYQPNIIHSAFHILMLNKNFLRDFHEMIAVCLDADKKELHEKYPDYISDEGIIARMGSWPAWLKRGIFFRDKGVCTICRNPLSGDLFLGIDPDMDHIVPLKRHGNNDPSNLQILCNICNNKKRHYNSATSSYDIPFWNLD